MRLYFLPIPKHNAHSELMLANERSVIRLHLKPTLVIRQFDESFFHHLVHSELWRLRRIVFVHHLVVRDCEAHAWLVRNRWDDDLHLAWVCTIIRCGSCDLSLFADRRRLHSRRALDLEGEAGLEGRDRDSVLFE